MKKIISLVLIVFLSIVSYSFLLPIQDVEAAVAITQKGSFLTYDAAGGGDGAMIQIDADHYLQVYSTSTGGYAQIMMPNTTTGVITNGAALQYNANGVAAHALAEIDSTHYLLTYWDITDTNGEAIVLTVDTGTDTVTAGTSFTYDADDVWSNSLQKIDANHFLNTYSADYSGNGEGTAIIITVAAGTYAVGAGAEHQFETGVFVGANALQQIDADQFINMYSDEDTTGGKSVVLTVDTGTDVVTSGTLNTFHTPLDFLDNFSLIQVDAENYLGVYQAQEGANQNGYAVLLKPDVDTSTITNSTPFQYAANVVGDGRGLAQINSTHFIHGGQQDTTVGSGTGVARVFSVDVVNDVIAVAASFNYESGTFLANNAIQSIDNEHFLISFVHEGGATDPGYAGLFRVSGVIEDTLGIEVNIADVIALDCGADVDFGTVTPGTPVSASTTCTITTNAETGYSFDVKREDPDTTMDHTTDDTANIPDITAWSGANSAEYASPGLAFRVYDGPDTGWQTDWDVDLTCPHTTSGDADYAGFPAAFTEIYDYTSYSSASTAVDICYVVDIAANQKSGSYDGVVIYQVYSNP